MIASNGKIVIGMFMDFIRIEVYKHLGAESYEFESTHRLRKGVGILHKYSLFKIKENPYKKL
jgi:hypothetical protein